MTKYYKTFIQLDLTICCCLKKSSSMQTLADLFFFKTFAWAEICNLMLLGNMNDKQESVILSCALVVSKVTSK